MQAKQKQQLQDIVNKYADIKGDYEYTMLQGIVHAYCDSGILTDALSVEDAERLNKYFTQEALVEGDLKAMSDFVQSVEGRALDCMTAIDEIADAAGDIGEGAEYVATLL